MCSGVSAPEGGAWLCEDGTAGEPLLPDAEPALQRHVTVPGPQRPVVCGRRGEVPGTDVALARVLPRVVCARCVETWLRCACWVTAPSARMEGGRGLRWPSLLATMSLVWLGTAGVFCRMASWDAAQSALISSPSLWWEVARAN